MSLKPKVQLNNKEWILLVLALVEEKSLTPIQLQKCLFLVGRKISTGKDYYNFKPYDYGPFALEIYRDAEELEKEGLINIVYASNFRWKLYSITPKGKKVVDEIEKRVLQSNIDMINTEIVGWVLEKGFRELVKKIYQKYPDFAVNSVFRG